ncbi:MAG TPA: uridine kinase, partial [Savagea sp.]
GAGKTTFVQEFQQVVQLQQKEVLIIHLDDHIVERNKRYATGNEEWVEYYYHQWDVEQLVSVLFQPLLEGSDTLSLPFYDKKWDAIHFQTVNVSPRAIVLIEGIFLQRPEWRAFFDRVFYLDCPREIRRQRVLSRDDYIGDQQAILDKYERRYWIAEDYYLQQVKPLQAADIIVPYGVED